jgi:hypothetical protein
MRYQSYRYLSFLSPWRLCAKLALVTVILTIATHILAADNELTSQEKADGWQLLFNGKDTAGWKNNNKKPVAARIEGGALNPHGSGGYVIVYKKPFGDFVLKCDVKMDQPYCNSGIFVRIGDLKDPVQTGLEAQIITEKKPDLHGFGAIYDLVAPSKNASHGPDKWDAIEVRCKGPKITVTVNGEKVSSIDCDEWRDPGKRLDGTSTKFKMAVKDFSRTGYIGLQDHGNNVWFKNVKLLKL